MDVLEAAMSKKRKDKIPSLKYKAYPSIVIRQTNI